MEKETLQQILSSNPRSPSIQLDNLSDNELYSLNTKKNSNINENTLEDNTKLNEDIIFGNFSLDTEPNYSLPSINTRYFQESNDNHLTQNSHNENLKNFKCSFCQRIGHSDDECLLKEDNLNIEMLKGQLSNNESLCYFCGSNSHLICPFQKNLPQSVILEEENVSENYNNEEPQEDEEEDEDIKMDFTSLLNFLVKKRNKFIIPKKKDNKQILNIPNSKIVDTMFCHKCGNVDNHNEKNKCPSQNLMTNILPFLDRNNHGFHE